MTVWLDKDRGRWRYKFLRGGRTYAGYCVHPDTRVAAKNRAQAKQIETLIKAAAIREPDRAAPAAYTLAQAMAALATRLEGTRNWPNQKLYAAELLRWFGGATPIADISETLVWQYIAWSRQQHVRVYLGGGRKPNEAPHRELWRKTDRKRADSTINRYLDCLRHALNIAARTRDPATGGPLLPMPPRVPQLEEPKIKPRPISDAALAYMIANGPPHLADAVALIAHMGFRKSEVFALRVHQVDEENRGVWLSYTGTKAKRDEFVPANEIAMAILLRLKRQAEAWEVEHLISYRPNGKGDPRPVKNPRKSFARMLRQLGLEGRHTFHNTRASFVTALGHKVPGAIAQALARHADFDTTRRYLEVADDAKRQAVNAIADRLATSGLDLSAALGKSLAPRRSRTRDSHTEDVLPSKVDANLLAKMVGAAGFEPATPSPPD